MIMPLGTRGKGTGPRPHTWITGPDPIRHEKYTAWLRCKAQAAYRGEPWEITFQEYERIWRDHWHLRSRTSSGIQMMRKDYDKPWSRHNVVLVDRPEFHRRQSARRMELNKRRKEKHE